MTTERTTMPRQWALLKALPIYPKKISIRQLWKQMDDLGYEVTKRTVERDLVILSLQFSITSDEAKPAGWSVFPSENMLSITDGMALEAAPIHAHAHSSSSIQTKDLKRLKVLFEPPDSGYIQKMHPANFIGREWLLLQVDQWLNSQKSPLLWLHGSPGVGKSAFCSWLIEQRQANVVGAFFCQYQHQKLPEDVASEAIRSIAFQLAQRLPEFRRELIKQQSQEKIEHRNCTADELFQALLLKPLLEIDITSVLNVGRYILLIDGLDEASSSGNTNVLINIVLKYADKLPSNVSMLVTSCPETNIDICMAGFDDIEITPCGQENLNDLHIWLEQQIPVSICGEQRQVIIDKLKKNSGGLFLYLHLLMQNPDIYWSNPELIPEGLDGYFAACFTRYFPEINNYSKYQRPLLELMVSALEPIPVSMVGLVLGWDEYLCDKVVASFGGLFSQSDTNAAHSSSTLYFDDDDNHRKLIPFHKALIDWLTDRNRAGLYRVSKRQAADHFANGLWAVYKNNVDNLPTYALRYLPTHLNAVGRHDDMRHCLLNIDFILKRANIPYIISDIDLLINEYRCASDNTESDHALWAWGSFFRSNGHHFQKAHQNWSAANILLQRAVEEHDRSLVRQAAEQYVVQNKRGYWLRSVTSNPSTACRVIDDGSDKWPPLLMDSYIVSANSKGQIKVWNSHSGQCLVVLNAHQHALSGMLALDTRHVVSWCNIDQTCCLWDIVKDTCVSVLSKDMGKINCVCLLANGEFIASFDNHELRIWDLTGKQRLTIHHDDEIKSIWPLANSNFLTADAANSDADSSHELYLWNGKTGERIRTITDLKVADLEIKTLPDGEILIWSQSGDEFFIYDSVTGQLLAKTSKDANMPVTGLKGNPARIMVAHKAPETDDFSLLTICNWLWNGKTLALENHFDLIPDKKLELNFEDAASAFDCQLFDDGRVLFPSPLSLWSGLTGKKLAILKGDWALCGELLSDFQGFYRRFPDGRLLTWTTQPLTGSYNMGDCFYLWDRNGKLICQVHVESHFRDIQILDNGYFITLNCDDMMSLWDGESGILQQTFVATSGVILNIQSLPDGQLLSWDSLNSLCLWPIAINGADNTSNRHASESEIHTQIFKDRILSYSFDAFPPKLWDANTGALIATLPAYNNALGAYLAGVIPLSDQRFLTWGNAPALHLYDAQQGQCLASLIDAKNLRMGQSQVWSLQNDKILCLLWDRSLRIWNLEANNFDSNQSLAHNVIGAQPLGNNHIVYWTRNGALSIWNMSENRQTFDFVGPIKAIKKVQVLSDLRLVITSSTGQLNLLDWHAGKSFAMDVGITSASKISETPDGKLIIYSDSRAEIWTIEHAISFQFAINLEQNDYLSFITQLPNGNILTQIKNARAILWSTWDGMTGELLGSTLMPNVQGRCVGANTAGQAVLLKISNKAINSHYYELLEWQDPEHLAFISLNNIAAHSCSLDVKKLIQQCSGIKHNWMYWASKNGSPIGLTRLGENTVYCEWHGEPISQFIELTDSGRVLGFGRRPVILQLFKGNQVVGFDGRLTNDPSLPCVLKH